MDKLLSLSQSLLAVLIIIAIVIQAKGAGLGQAWGGSGAFYSSRRGVEKILFRATLVMVGLFFVVSLLIHLI